MAVLAGAVAGDRVLGEQRGQLVPVLLVEAAQIGVLEPRDGIDLDEVLGGHRLILAHVGVGWDRPATSTRVDERV